MLTLEQYASVYLPMVTAAGDTEKENELCDGKGLRSLNGTMPNYFTRIK